MPDVSSIVAWLTDGAPADLALLTDGLVERLTAAGVRLARVRVGLGRIHPEIASTAASWTRGARAELQSVTHAFIREVQRGEQQASPIAQVMYSGVDELRVPLRDTAVAPHSPLAELKA